MSLTGQVNEGNREDKERCFSRLVSSIEELYEGGKMKVYGEPTRSIRSIDDGMAVEILDQTSLPFRFEKVVLTDWRDCVEAIREMRVRGATLTGIAGAWAMVLATLENPSNEAIKTAAEVIAAARPTSASLAAAVHRMYSTIVPREATKRFAAAVKLTLLVVRTNLHSQETS